MIPTVVEYAKLEALAEYVKSLAFERYRRKISLIAYHKSRKDHAIFKTFIEINEAAVAELEKKYPDFPAALIEFRKNQ